MASRSSANVSKPLQQYEGVLLELPPSTALMQAARCPVDSPVPIPADGKAKNAFLCCTLFRTLLT